MRRFGCLLFLALFVGCASEFKNIATKKYKVELIAPSGVCVRTWRHESKTKLYVRQGTWGSSLNSPDGGIEAPIGWYIWCREVTAEEYEATEDQE